MFVKVMSLVSRKILRSIKVHTSCDFEINILSAQIDEGLWTEPKYSLLGSLQKSKDIPEILSKPEAIFVCYFENYLKAFDLDLLKSIFPQKLSGNLAYAIQFFDELYITFISILISLKRMKDALVYLDQLIDISKAFNFDLIVAKLKLIKASLVLEQEHDAEVCYSLLVSTE